MTPKKKTPIQTSKDQAEQEETTLSLPLPDPKLASTISSYHKKRSYQKSGQYQIIESKGGKTNAKETFVKGKPLPPKPDKRPKIKVGKGKQLSLPLPDPKLGFKISSHHDKWFIQKPGQSALKSGQYQIVGPKGGKTGFKITAVKGKTLPPTPKSGQRYVLVDVTKHKDGK